jgi:ribosomal protein S18 acetylase RimI-like enzyme
MQHRAREAAYAAAFPGAADRLVIVGGQPAGRVLVSRTESEHRVVDIAILPAHQGLGIGSSILRALADEASAAGRPLRLTVAADNRAVGLYRRIGFRTVWSDEMNLCLELRPRPISAVHRLS